MVRTPGRETEAWYVCNGCRDFVVAWHRVEYGIGVAVRIEAIAEKGAE